MRNISNTPFRTYHHVIYFGISDNPSVIFDQGLSIDTCRDGPTCINFGLDLVGRFQRRGQDRVGTIFRQGRIGKIINFSTSATHAGKGITSAASIGSRTSRIDMRAKAIPRFVTTSNVGKAGVIRDISFSFDKLVDTSVGSAMTRSGDMGTTVQKILNRKINFIAARIGNLDAVGQSAQRSVGPTRSAILRNVLIERVCQIRMTVDIAPIKVIGQILLVNISVGKRRSVVITDLVAFENLKGQKETSCM